MQKKSVDYVSRQLPLQGLALDSEYHSQESIQSEELGQKPIDMVTQGKVNQTIGLAGEDLVRYLLHRWRYEVFTPCNPSSRCDFVINHNDKWIKIQVKTTEKKDQFQLKRRNYQSRKVSDTNAPRTVVGTFLYREGDFDYVFTVKFPKIYVIPFNAVKAGGKNYKSQTISLKNYEEYAYDLTDPEVFNNPPNL